MMSPARIMVECPCCHRRKRLTVIEHNDEDGGRTTLARPLCCHCMGEGEVAAEDQGYAKTATVEVSGRVHEPGHMESTRRSAAGDMQPLLRSVARGAVDMLSRRWRGNFLVRYVHRTMDNDGNR